jgi:hypothetical protein
VNAIGLDSSKNTFILEGEKKCSSSSYHTNEDNTITHFVFSAKSSSVELWMPQGKGSKSGTQCIFWAASSTKMTMYVLHRSHGSNENALREMSSPEDELLSSSLPGSSAKGKWELISGFSLSASRKYSFFSPLTLILSEN